MLYERLYHCPMALEYWDDYVYVPFDKIVSSFIKSDIASG